MRIPPLLLLISLGLWLILGDVAEHGPSAVRQLQAQAPAKPPRKYAILVGVEAYRHPKLREPPPLQYAIEDVTELADVLKNAGYVVVLLTDDTGSQDDMLQPTKANIDAQLQATLRKYSEQDTVLLAFAGHGLQFAGQPDAYFCPLDARPFSDETETLVSISRVYQELDKSFAGVKVILIDACRNDPTPGRGRGLDADAAPAPPKGVAALFSCSAGQKAFEHDQLKHGVFFHHVLQGLKSEAGNRRSEVTFEALAIYVRDAVPATIEKLLPGHDQSPNMKADLVGRPPVLAMLPTITSMKPGDVITNTIGMKLVLIPAGEFLMGSPASEANRLESEGPQHRVQITKSFLMGQYEVTQAEWRTMMGTNPSRFDGLGEGRDIVFDLDTSRFPVEQVSWYDAVEFCNKLSERENLSPYYMLSNLARKEGSIRSATVSINGGRGYRLPTEAEWEYACRAGTTTPFHFGAASNGYEANVDGKYPYGTDSEGPYLKRTTNVGSYTPNAFGLYDLHGNVSELCADWYETTAYQGRMGTTHDPLVQSGERADRVLRGGAWDNYAGSTRSANRHWHMPGVKSKLSGFRLARTP